MAEKAVGSHLIVQVLSSPFQGRAWIVSAARPLLIGREIRPAPDVAVFVIPDPRISSEHCRIECSEGAFRVVDLNSRNGVLVNGTPVPRGGTAKLENGDVLSLAEIALEVRIGATPEAVSPRTTRSLAETEFSGAGSLTSTPLVPELLPFPLAMGIRKVKHVIGPLDAVNEMLKSFEAILRFQTLVAMSEYLCGASRDEGVGTLLESFQQRPFTLGRWLELYLALTRALARDDGLVVQEMAERPAHEEEAIAWRSAAARLVELRNSLLHGEGIGSGSAELVADEMAILLGHIISGLAFWVGYRFVAVEPGSWSDEEEIFQYPCRLLLGHATPFETQLLKTATPLPTRVPIIINRDCTRRLSLGPFQAILPGEDKQLHWFWLSEFAAGRMVLLTYPGSLKTTIPATENLAKLLAGERSPSKARAQFSGNLSKRGKIAR